MATTMNLKLVVDKKTNKLLFAEAGKDFADFLMGLLTLPIGSVIRLLTKQKMVGCMGKLYESIENLNDTFIQQGRDKNFLLNPTCPNPPLLLQNEVSTTRKNYYCCSEKHPYVTQILYTHCPAPGCRKTMCYELSMFPKITTNAFSEGGFAKDALTYMVTDDLVVTPITSISSFVLTNKFNLKDAGVLEEKGVKVGMKEGLALLKASLHSNTALSDVFLGK
ncbi:uncharacterized protein LOC143891872 [Tasmannia lanceolata]|uniref:uncharacterized protein LOC143891872 n=1 Tax=Tasmannia lanceolata TaxID=3420 RepID=UPI004064541A